MLYLTQEKGKEVKTMKTIEINIYTPKEIATTAVQIVETYYYWWKTRKIRKPYGITCKNTVGQLADVMSNEDKEKMIAMYPEKYRETVQLLLFSRRMPTVPPGKFR